MNALVCAPSSFKFNRVCQYETIRKYWDFYKLNMRAQTKLGVEIQSPSPTYELLKWIMMNQ